MGAPAAPQPREAPGAALRRQTRSFWGPLTIGFAGFTPPGGHVRLWLGEEGEAAVITVSDTGPGISADELPHVFERFFRGKGVRAGGSGVGLTVARELVRAHGGELQVATEPGRGATFTVRLPVASSGPRALFTDTSHRTATVGAMKGDQS